MKINKSLTRLTSLNKVYIHTYIQYIQAVCKLILARPLSIDSTTRLPVARILESTKFWADRKKFYVVDRLRNVQNA